TRLPFGERATSLDLAEKRLRLDRLWSVTVQDHGLKPRHDIGKQRTGTVLALSVRVSDRDEPGNSLSFVLRDAAEET
ncbi:MAG: hypothetical protein ACRECZ_01905, partial [Methylocella sp.]